jgi:sec-independent protein translocase protein TatB
MFDIGFTELLVIGVVALVVIGPERLPKVARTAGQWLGRLNRYVSQVKQDIDRDMRLEELRKMQQEMKDSAQKYEIMADEALHRVEDTVTQETGQISKVMQAMAATDGGLTMAEYEKLRAEENTQGAADGEAKALPEPGSAPSQGEGVEPAHDNAVTVASIQADAAAGPDSGKS